MAKSSAAPATRFVKKPVVVEAIQWKGGLYQCLNEFCGENWGRADVKGSGYWPSDIPDKEEVVIFNTQLQAWIPVPTGWWIVRGIQGELYPCKPDIFAESYKVAPPETPKPSAHQALYEALSALLPRVEADFQDKAERAFVCGEVLLPWMDLIAARAALALWLTRRRRNK